MNTIKELHLHLSDVPVKRLRVMGEGLQPIAQAQLDAIRDAVTLELVAQLKQLEQGRDALLRRASNLEAGLEMTASFRSNLT